MSVAQRSRMMVRKVQIQKSEVWAARGCKLQLFQQICNFKNCDEILGWVAFKGLCFRPLELTLWIPTLTGWGWVSLLKKMWLHSDQLYWLKNILISCPGSNPCMSTAQQGPQSVSQLSQVFSSFWWNTEVHKRNRKSTMRSFGGDAMRKQVQPCACGWRAVLYWGRGQCGSDPKEDQFFLRQCFEFSWDSALSFPFKLHFEANYFWSMTILQGKYKVIMYFNRNNTSKCTFLETMSYFNWNLL